MPPTGSSGNTMPLTLRTVWWRVSWNRALAYAAEIEGKIAMHDAATPAPIADPAPLGVLASNLKTVWDAPTTDARLKKRIVRTLSAAFFWLRMKPHSTSSITFCFTELRTPG
ncbi:hypothetical protein ACVWXN_007347 [Bradyrhizobium sp. i1.4.4]|uniref:hypothetical protein n=1 Tax=Bradyrhizobium sp. LA6.10 TaxID=3156318 RepID=UPI0033976F37